METEIREILEFTDKNIKRATITIVQLLKGKHKHCKKIIFLKEEILKRNQVLNMKNTSSDIK